MSNDAPFIRPVPQQFPGTALSGAQTNLLGSLSFPDAGGVQGVDKTGAVLNLAGAGGAVTATVTDAVTDAASTALLLVHALSAGVGANNIGVTQRFVLPNSLGVAASAGQFTVSYTDATSGSEDSALGLTLQVGGAGTPVLAISAPTAGATTLTAAGSASASLNLVGAGGIAIAPTVVTSGSQTAFKVTSAANTTQAAGVNAPAVDLNLSASVQFATGAIADLTAIRVLAPTYTFVGASTVTRAATLYIDTAPSVTAPSTATNTYAILVDAGTVRFDDLLSLGGNISLSGAATTITATTADQGITLASSGLGVVALQGSGAANIVAVDNGGGLAAARLGFFNVTPLIRQTVADCVPAPDGTSAGTQLNALLASLRLFGLLT